MVPPLETLKFYSSHHLGLSLAPHCRELGSEGPGLGQWTTRLSQGSQAMSSIFRGFQSVVPAPAVSSSPGSLLDMPILGPPTTKTNLIGKPWGWGPTICVVASLRGILMRTNVWKALLYPVYLEWKNRGVSALAPTHLINCEAPSNPVLPLEPQFPQQENKFALPPRFSEYIILGLKVICQSFPEIQISMWLFLPPKLARFLPGDSPLWFPFYLAVGVSFDARHAEGHLGEKKKNPHTTKSDQLVQLSNNGIWDLSP